MNYDSIGLGILTINGSRRLSVALQSIFDTYPDFPSQQIYLVDDGSSERELKLIRAIAEHFKIGMGEHRKNLGISAGWNHCFLNLNKEKVVLLNDDIKLTPGWLEALDFFVENNEDVGMAGLFCYDEDGKVFCTDNGERRYDIDFSVPHRGLCSNGYCFMMKITHWSNFGNFDEQYYSFYEEVDFGLNLARNGMPSYNIPWPVIHHEWGATFRENSDLLPQIRMQESRKRFIEKWGKDIGVVYQETMPLMEDVELTWLTKSGPEKGRSIPMVR